MKGTLLTIAAIGAQAMVLPCLAADIGAVKAPPVAAPAPVFSLSRRVASKKGRDASSS